jgi:hypothetical protein
VEKRAAKIVIINLIFEGQSSEILICFLTYIDRPRPEYEPLLILTFFRGSYDLRF